MLQSLRYLKYFPFFKGNRFKTAILALILISGNFCLAQDLAEKNCEINNNFKFDDYSDNNLIQLNQHSTKNKKDVESYLSINGGISLYTLKGNTTFGLHYLRSIYYDVYTKIGVSVYTGASENVSSETKLSYSADLALLLKINLSHKFIFFTGGDVNYFWSSNLLGITFFSRINYSLSNRILIGIDFKHGFNIKNFTYLLLNISFKF